MSPTCYQAALSRDIFGTRGRSRTADIRIMIPVFYQLNYSGVDKERNGGDTES